jgi:protein-tyrosine phosphatase
MKKILFVCTGNICRSSTAEALLRQVVSKRMQADQYFIDSCGTHDYHVGGKSDIRAAQVAKERGVDMGDIRARQITGEDFNAFHHIFAMDRGNFRILKSIAPPSYTAKISLFLDHSAQQIKDVPDPYYGNLKGFDEALNILEIGMDGLLNFVDDTHG